MITKERLEELIYNEQTIWVVYDEERIEHIKLITKMFGVSVDEYNQINKCEPTLYSNFCGVFKDICSLKNCFETKGDVEEFAEFGNITRTERLELPSWEEFKTTETITKFFNKDTNYSLYVYVKNKNTNNCKIMIYADNGEQEWWEFQKPLTRENYNEARRLCVKLFKGEEIDGKTNNKK